MVFIPQKTFILKDEKPFFLNTLRTCSKPEHFFYHTTINSMIRTVSKKEQIFKDGNPANSFDGETNGLGGCLE